MDDIVPCIDGGDDITRKGAFWRLVIFAFLLAFAIKPIWWASGGDTSFYLSVARSLWEQGQLQAFGQREIFNQIGVSIYFAPAFAFGEYPFVALSILQWFAAVGAMLGCYHWLRRYAKRDDAILITALVMFNVCFWLYYLRFLTEIWACCLLFNMALVLRHVIDQLKKQQTGRAWRWLLGSLPIMIWMVLTRHVTSMIALGFALALILLAWQIKRRTVWIHAVLMMILVNAIAGGTAVGWLLYQQSTVSSELSVRGSYLSFVANDMTEQDQGLLHIAADNTHRRMTNVGRAVVPGMFRTYPNVGQWLAPLSLLNAAISVVLLVGFIKLARGSLDPMIWMPLFYLGLLWCLPYEGGTRFMLLIMPVVWLSLHRFLQGRRWRKNAFLVLIVLHMIVTVGRVLSVYPDELSRHRQWPVMQQIAQRISEIDSSHQWFAVGIDSDWVTMISYAGDRELFEWHIRGDRQPAYIIVFDGVEPPEGYSLIQTIDKYHLMKKD